MFKKNAAVTGFPIGHFIQTADGAAKTTGTPTCKRLLDGTAGTLTNAASYDATAGVWKIDLAAGDMDGDMVGLVFSLADCIPISYAIRTSTSLVSDVETDTADIQTRLPAALVDGRIEARIGEIAPSTITASAFDGDAITSVAIAGGAIGAKQLAEDAGTEIAAAVRTELAAELARIDEDVSAGAHAGDAMTLADDAITAAKYDQTTAHPLALADTGSTAVARTGADSDTLETLSDEIAGSGLTAQETRDAMKLAPTAGTPAAGSVDAHLDSILATGAGSGTGTYSDTVTDGVDPLDNVLVQLSTDAAGTNIAYQTYTAANGSFTLRPDPGTYYVWFELAGYSFTQGAQVVVI